jgi:hypothetical protein
LWIPYFGLLAKPLYTASTQDALEKPLDPSKPIKALFTELKEALLRAPALGLQDYSWPFSLYLHTNHNIILAFCLRIMATYPDLSLTYLNH